MPPSSSSLPPSEAFDELARLVLSEHSVESVMTAVAEVGKRLLPAAADVSVTLVRGGRAETVATTGPLALLMDERQYEGGDGPCLTAARTGAVVEVGAAQAAEQWPLFAAGAREHGVGSSLSLPLVLPEPVSAALNLYSLRPDGFGEQDLELGSALAAYAAVALTNIHLYAAQRRVAENLERALESRGIIDQAKGILMARRRCTADDAFQALVELSQQTNRKLRDVAEQLVAGAVDG